MKKIKLSKTGKAIVSLLAKIAVITLVITALLTWVGGVFVCHSNDMNPLVKDGDLVITYKLGGYYNGDAIVYEFDGDTYFGRVVGKSGDVIDFNEGGYTVNGNYPFETVFFPTEPVESDVRYPITLKEDELFVLADYRTEGLDSRTFGIITKPKGKIVILLRRRGI